LHTSTDTFRWRTIKVKLKLWVKPKKAESTPIKPEKTRTWVCNNARAQAFYVHIPDTKYLRVKEEIPGQRLYPGEVDLDEWEFAGVACRLQQRLGTQSSHNRSGRGARILFLVGRKADGTDAGVAAAAVALADLRQIHHPVRIDLGPGV